LRTARFNVVRRSAPLPRIPFRDGLIRWGARIRKLVAQSESFV